jgi:hypothetical protein
MANTDVDPTTHIETPIPPNANGKSTNGADDTQPADAKSADAKPAPINIAGFKIGDIDGAGRLIEDIYFKRATYVIYCTGGNTGTKVLVQYADDPDLATKQIAALAELIPLRNRLQSLLADIPKPDQYFAQIAEAFRLGLEGQLDIAKQTLTDAIAEVQNLRASAGRNIYINQAGPIAAAVATVLLLVSAIFLYFGSAQFGKAWSPLAHMLVASGAGALGALLSIAISVRTRTVATDGDDLSIRIDASLRVLIGVLSAAVLYLILGTGVMSQIKIGDMTFNPGAIVWQLALLLGFAAGFLERLVPDLLDKKTA